MTVVVSFLCSDGAVVAADSMLTPSLGSVNVGHHHGKKIDIITGPQIHAFAGDHGQAARFKHLADTNSGLLNTTMHAMDYVVQLSGGIIQQFIATGINSSINVNAILCFSHRLKVNCCVFEGAMQPRLLDENHFYTALGSGKLSADPFLRFLVDIFCPNGQPNVREAVFLATWAIQHVIDTNPGGVAGPIRVTTLQIDQNQIAHPRELPDQEIGEHQQAIESAAAALRNWRDGRHGMPFGAQMPAPPQGPIPAPAVLSAP